MIAPETVRKNWVKVRNLISPRPKKGAKKYKRREKRHKKIRNRAFFSFLKRKNP
jgi:hypothetical protein